MGLSEAYNCLCSKTQTFQFTRKCFIEYTIIHDEMCSNSLHVSLKLLIFIKMKEMPRVIKLDLVKFSWLQSGQGSREETMHFGTSHRSLHKAL